MGYSTEFIDKMNKSNERKKALKIKYEKMIEKIFDKPTKKKVAPPPKKKEPDEEDEIREEDEEEEKDENEPEEDEAIIVDEDDDDGDYVEDDVELPDLD